MYVRVWKVTIEAVDGKYLLKCSNMQQKNRGMPWHNMLRVIDNRKVPENDLADVSMFDIRNWKMVNAHYGEDNNLGKQLMDAQHQCFKYENAGIPFDLRCVSLSAEVVPGHSQDPPKKVQDDANKQHNKNRIIVLDPF